jgi:endonuclease-3 related protein
MCTKRSTREQLLSLWGIGRETADSILLYAFNYPIFVVDTYTRRLLAAHGQRKLAQADYDKIRMFFETRLPRDHKLFNEYHALIVRWGKTPPPLRRPRRSRAAGDETVW